MVRKASEETTSQLKLKEKLELARGRTRGESIPGGGDSTLHYPYRQPLMAIEHLADPN